MVGLSVFLLIGIIAILAVFFYFVPFLLWISARVSGVRISLIQLFLMRITPHQKKENTRHKSLFEL